MKKNENLDCTTGKDINFVFFGNFNCIGPKSHEKCKLTDL